MLKALRETLHLRRAAEEAAADLPALMTRAERAVAGILHGDHAQRKPGPGERFWQYREYTPGDRPQDIDWRQSAKTDHVYIRQKERQTTQTAIFWCDEGESMEFSSDKIYPEKIWEAKTLLLALAILMTRAGEQVGLYGGARTGRSELTLQRMGEALCHGARDFKALPDPLRMKLPRDCTLVQIGDFLSPLEDIEKVFKTLSAQTESGLVVQILDPAEIELPYNGRVIFEELSTRESISHVDSIRAQYRQRIEAHTEAVHDLCRQQHWSYVLHRTDQPLSETLSRIWSAMNRGALESGELLL